MKNIKNKKNKIFILVLLTLIVVISICLFVYITTIMHKKDDSIEEDLNATKEENEVVENTENNENNNLEIDSKYVDDNPIVVGLYVKEGNYKKLVKDYYCGWDPEEVGLKSANRLGLFDMSGNVWEWCFDETNLLPVHEKTETKERIMRGGGWPNHAYDLCISERYSLPPEHYEKENCFSDVGFRVCRSI